MRFGTYLSFDLEPISNEIWSTVFHRRFGLCYALDLSKSEKWKQIQLGKYDGQPNLVFFLAKRKI